MKKKEKNYYILSLYANKVIDEIEEKGDYQVDIEYLKRYRTIHNSMMLEHLKKIDKEFIYKETDNDIYTLSVVNIKFDDNKRKWENNKVVKNYSGARNKLYEEGFTVNGIRYTEFQRSSSKSRNGNNLFIREDLLQEMQKFTRINLDIEGVLCDVGSFRAYESLTSSDIDGKVIIKPENILLVSDIKGYCKASQSITERDSDGNFHVVEKENVEVKNDIFDGESLLDKSRFTGNYKGKGFILLRNHFFKTAAFNTNIQEFFKDKGVKIVYDMFGNPHKAEEILMITTPNSVKLFKFNNLIKGNSMENTWNYLLQHLEKKWGICKTDHKSKFRDDFSGTQQMSYQFINSMPLSKKEVEKLAELEIDYSNKLKRDFEAFKEFTGLKDSSEHRFILRMVEVNPLFRGTPYFKAFYNEQLKYRKETLQQGKIRIKGSDNMTFLGNPLELLRHAIGEDIREGDIHSGYQVFTKKYKDGEKIAMFRSPHLASGNIVYAENKWLEDFKYINLTKNIIIINSYDSDIYNRLQGADLDSDFAFVTNNKIIVEKAKECQKWLTPVNAVEADKKLRKFCQKEKAIVDKKISNNCIGIICNTGQILNSWLWEFENKGEDDKAHKIYNLISELSSLSQLEIDKAKKLVSINMQKEISNIIDKSEEIGVPIIVAESNRKKLVQPHFFLKKNQIENAHNKSGFKRKKSVNPEEYQKLNCPMDYLIDVLKEKTLTKKEVATIQISEILSSGKMAHKDNKTVLLIEEMAEESQKEIQKLWNIFEESPTEYFKERNKQEEILKEEYRKMEITPEIIARVIFDCFSLGQNRPFKKIISWLWDAQTEVFEKYIQENKLDLSEEEISERLKVRRKKSA